MASCSACGGELEPGDRFCGTCGAEAPADEPAPDIERQPGEAPQAFEPGPEPAGEVPLPAEQPEWDEWQDDSPPPPRRRPLIFAVLAAAVGLAGAAFAWQVGMLDPQGSDVAEPTTPPAPVPDTGQLPQMDGITGALDEVTQAIDGAGTAPTGEPLIRPGLWEIVRRVDAVLTRDLSDPGIPRDSLPIGNQEQELQCVNAQIAADPRAYAFPAERAGHCSVNSFAMASGRYRAQMLCSWMGQRRPIAFEGSYNDTSLDLMMNVELPANEIAGDSHGTRPLVMRYHIEGHHIGPC